MERDQWNKEEAAWLVLNRARLPQELLRLRERWSSKSMQPGHGAQSLVGVGFTLWRALPLMPKASSTPTKSADNAIRLLDEIMIHNRINYPEELRCADWLVGFYLNAAEERIWSVAKQWGVSNQEIEECIKYRLDPERRHSTSYRRRWETALLAFSALIGEMDAPASVLKSDGRSTR